MVSLIINADDLGYNEPRTQAIFDFFRRGLVSNTTLMVNMPYADEAVVQARALRLADRVGLHLNLTEGEPLSEAIRHEPLFCDEAGKFNAAFLKRPLYRFYMPKRLRVLVRGELQAQIDRFLSYGLPQRHVDSHNHVHTFLPILSELIPIVKKCRFRSVRKSMNLREGGYPFSKRIYKVCVNFRLEVFPGQADYFCDFWTVLPFLQTLDGHLVEVMTHPLRCEDGVGDEATYGDGYETKAQGLQEIIESQEGAVNLVHY